MRGDAAGLTTSLTMAAVSQAAVVNPLARAATDLIDPKAVLDELTALENALNLDDVAVMAALTKQTTTSLKKYARAQGHTLRTDGGDDGCFIGGLNSTTHARPSCQSWLKP